MSLSRLLILLYVIVFINSSCRQKASVEGVWKPFKVKIWDSYRDHFALIDLYSKSFTYSDSVMQKREMRPVHEIDSIMDNMLTCYLSLNKQGHFEMNDHAFFTQVISDSAWQGLKTGTWVKTNSLLELTQESSLKKCFKIIDQSEETLTLGELYQCSDRPITEIFLRRQNTSANM
ncbi:hypothetical protein LZZ85_10590 [Terrimonas sp. NA20]|uniref:Lipocalin-like domain-containing protein n=1 Tax=Terrimonas ginsenosidimutans TaxID=2908004 RepID=A0ABS9KQZ6_9BACT|nr:hypothetical protein [Terrimonas ginsenosidimutans]MCG2614732.1 hypothetical protein [Terrimonas ginsenosidimutans]